MSDDKKPKIKKPSVKSAKSQIQSSQKKWIIGSVLVVGIVLIVAHIAGTNHANFKKPKPPAINTTPGSNNLYQSDLANNVQNLTSQNSQLRKQLGTLSKQMLALESKQKKQTQEMQSLRAQASQATQNAGHGKKGSTSGNNNNPKAPMKGSSFKAPPPPQQKNGFVPPPPPATGYGNNQGKVSGASNGSPATPSPIIVENTAAAKKNKNKYKVKWKKNAYAGYLPAGSFAKAVLLTGVDAGTSNYTRSNPEPVLMRVQNNARLPGASRYGIKACFLIGSGYGDLSSQRVYIRLNHISCVSQTLHAIVSSKISGYVVDSDGVLGMRGRVINRTGALLGKALLAGFAQGAAQIAQYASSSITTSSLTGAVTQTIKPSEILKSGGFAGVGKAASILAKAYIREAHNIYPVIEVPPGRKASIVISAGISLHWKSYKGLYKAIAQSPKGGSVQLNKAKAQTASAFQNGQQNNSQSNQNANSGAADKSENPVPEASANKGSKAQ